MKPNAEARLRAELGRGNKVRIIVGLASADEPDASRQHGVSQPSSERKKRRESVQRLQQRVLGKMKTSKNVKKLRNFSYLAMEVNEQELSQLEGLSEVESIAEDELWSVSLDDSAPQIGADVAWSAGYTGLGQAVAVIDTGIDSNHPSLAGKVVAEACFSTGYGASTSLCPDGENPLGADYQTGPGAGANCSGLSTCSHGTHVAGIAAGNSSTYSGVAPDAYLLSIQVFSRFDSSACRGSSDCLQAYSSDILRAFDWIYDQQDDFAIASVNLSLGGGKYQSVAECDQANSALKVAINDLRNAGTATVASAGNDGHTSALARPACVSGAISVGAVSSSDVVANWSNSAPWLSVLAPGKGIKSAVPGSGFGSKSGTSMASPHVAGAIAAMRSADQNASIDDITAAIVTTGVPVTDSRNGVVTPRLQLDDAIAELLQTSITPIPDPEPGPAPEGSADLILTPNTLDSGEYGWRWGNRLHETGFTVAFQHTGASYEFDVTGYGIGSSDEIALYLNGTLIGHLSKGPIHGLNGGDTFEVPTSAQVTGENLLTFGLNRPPGEKWGVTNLLLRQVSNEFETGDLELTPNVLHQGKHGWRWGDRSHETDFTVAFQYTGVDLNFDVTGFGISYSDEVAVFLNGKSLGFLSKGPNHDLNTGDTFVIPASAQVTGGNLIEFKQLREPGEKWGVTDLLISD